MTEVRLTQGRVGLIDDEDLAIVKQHSWIAVRVSGSRWYARANSPSTRNPYMHRLLMNPQPGFFVDHINGDGLDNRRSNLRECSQAQNNINLPPRSRISKFKGIQRNKRAWHARISPGGRLICLGTFPTEEAAARAYDTAARAIYGEFAYLNFPGEEI